MPNKVETHVFKSLKTELKVIESPKFTSVKKAFTVEVQNPNPDIVELAFMYGNKEFVVQMTAEQARDIGNMLYAVADASAPEWEGFPSFKRALASKALDKSKAR
jgi:hypothetical protein